MNIYVAGFVVAVAAGVLAYLVCIRTGWLGCVLVALAPPLAFVAIGMSFVPPERENDCDPCGLGGLVFALLAAAATLGIWVGVAAAVGTRHRPTMYD